MQQIIALKFFGFELSQIKALLSEERKVLQHFTAQAQVLEQKAAAMMTGATTLRNIVDSIGDNKSIPWETIIQLIEVYKMAEHLEHGWVKEIFTPEELKQYMAFEQELKAGNKVEFETQWQQLLDEVKSAMQQAPDSLAGIETGKKYMEWVNGVYGKKYAHLRTKKWEKGFGEGKGLDDVGLTYEVMAWLEKALDAYWKDRLYGILTQLGKTPASTVLQLWESALDDMYGEETQRKYALCEIALQSDEVSPEAKTWLKGIMNSYKL